MKQSEAEDLIAQHENAFVEILSISDQHASLARRHRLGAVKAEHARVTEATGLPSRVLGSKCFRRIFDDREAVPPGNREDLVQPRHVAIEIHHNDCFRGRRDAGGE